MIWKNNPAVAIRLLVPTLVAVVAATAVPVELRPLGHVHVDFTIQPADVMDNILLYFALGLVLGEYGFWRAVMIAAAMSAFAETSQLFMVHRVCSAIDFATNVTGAIAGAAVSVHWGIRSLRVKIDRWMSLVALVGALGIALIVYHAAGPPPNPRGVTSAGRLEAWWKLDESNGRVAYDSSGHGVDGSFVNEPRHVTSELGRSIELDGRKDYLDVGRSQAIRLSGSMTITAWINSASFPPDDAAIVSQSQPNSGFGYQLDTTQDLGPRTIGFRLNNSCGNDMIRYGATTLALHQWYHLAGVYDAAKPSLNVYLNGVLDNGQLVGTVTKRQRSARWPTFIGRRTDQAGYEFAGMLRDVRIYSYALTGPEVAAVVHGEKISDKSAEATTRENDYDYQTGVNLWETGPGCRPISNPGDETAPAAVALLGMLVAIACVALWPNIGPLPCAAASLAAGLLLLPAIAPNLPAFNLWTIPLAALAGGASIALSLRRQNRLTNHDE